LAGTVILHFFVALGYSDYSSGGLTLIARLRTSHGHSSVFLFGALSVSVLCAARFCRVVHSSVDCGRCSLDAISVTRDFVSSVVIRLACTCGFIASFSFGLSFVSVRRPDSTSPPVDS
jgi:hypothetical protein